MIAVFAGIAEIAATVALPQLDATVQETFVWFVMGFPTVLVLLFFVTLNFNAKVLYAPGDYRDDSTFERMIGTPYAAASGETVALQQAVQQVDVGGTSDVEVRLQDWMRREGLQVSLTTFLYSAKYAELRTKAARELGLSSKE